MSRFALVRKELYDLVLERRMLLVLLLISALFSLALAVALDQPASDPASPLEFLGMIRYVGPVLVGLLAVALAGDAVARERQDRTLHLLFTAPATRTRYWLALLVAHLVAFAALAVLLLLFSILVGVTMGWVAVKGMGLLIVVSLLPLFLTLDLLVLTASTQLARGSTSLLVAIVLVLLLWCTSLIGPFGWALEGIPWWQVMSLWHPFDLAGASAASLLERGTLSWMPVVTASIEALLVGTFAWAGIGTTEVGR